MIQNLTNTDAEYIDVELVEAVLATNNGLELRWLKHLLKGGMRIKGKSGRYLKGGRFLKELNLISEGED